MAQNCDPSASWNKGKWSGLVNVGSKKKRLTTGDAFTENVATLISDSICQNFQNCLSTSFQCMHGGHLAKFVEYSNRKLIYVCNFSQILLFFGTNDISSAPGPDTPSIVVASLARAVAHIRELNDTARIGMCQIMPRPCDQIAAQSPDKITKERGKLMLITRRKTNDAMAQWCFVHNIPFFKASSCLKGKDKTIPLFCADNLHLSQVGTEHLQNYLEGKVGVLRGLPPQV